MATFDISKLVFEGKQYKSNTTLKSHTMFSITYENKNLEITVNNCYLKKNYDIFQLKFKKDSDVEPLKELDDIIFQRFGTDGLSTHEFYPGFNQDRRHVKANFYTTNQRKPMVIAYIDGKTEVIVGIDNIVKTINKYSDNFVTLIAQKIWVVNGPKLIFGLSYIIHSITCDNPYIPRFKYLKDIKDKYKHNLTKFKIEPLSIEI